MNNEKLISGNKEVLTRFHKDYDTTLNKATTLTAKKILKRLIKKTYPKDQTTQTDDAFIAKLRDDLKYTQDTLDETLTELNDLKFEMEDKNKVLREKEDQIKNYTSQLKFKTKRLEEID